MDHVTMSSGSGAEYKARKEAFVSNLAGSSLTEINLVTLVAAVCMLRAIFRL